MSETILPVQGAALERSLMASDASNSAAPLGARVHQIEGKDKVTGRAVYTHDVMLPNMLYCAIVRSPHAHARILEVDVSEARKAKGVVEVITGADFSEKYINFGPAYSDRYPIAKDFVRFVGEEVAAVAAETLEAATAAAAAVRIRYEVLPNAVTPEQALSGDAPSLHAAKANLPENVAQQLEVEFGDVKEGLRRSKHTVTGSFQHGIVWPVCMETNATVASFDTANKTLQVWTGTQAPYFVRKELANVLGQDIASIHVRSVAIGGGFGGKSQAPEQVAVVALLAVKTGRPVKIVLSRLEEYHAGKNDHGKAMTLTTGVDAEGNVLAREMHAVIDNGAYTHMGPVYMSAVRQRTTSLYRVGSASVDAKLVYTNKVPGGSYRGMGAPGVIWPIETQVDQLAEKLNLDPVEYRLRIANQPGDETILGWKITSCGLSECISRAADMIGWSEKWGKLPPMRGIGIASMIHPSGSVLYAEGNYANVSLVLNRDGTMLLGTQTADAGTGQNTTLVQFVSQTIHVPMERISVLHMDTEKNPDDLGSAASRVTFVTGNAAVDAASRLDGEVVKRLAIHWGVDPGLVVNDLGVFVERDGTRRMTMNEVAQAFGPIQVVGRHEIDLARLDPKTGYGNYAVAYAFGAQAAEVEIDPNTGHVKILKITSAQDVGKVVNPVALEGQTYGGIVQGIGMALSEEVIFEEGRPVNTSLVNYRVPRIAETPEIEVAFIETEDKRGPFGAKAAGEPTINATVAAIANAVANATGVRFMKLPITPERVLEALRQKGVVPSPATKAHKRIANIEIAAVRALYPKGMFPALKMLGGAVAKDRPRVLRFDVHNATSSSDAVAALSRDDKRTKVIGGGTELLPGIRQGIYGPELVVDCSSVPGARQLYVGDGLLRIGASVTLSELEESEELRSVLPAFCDAISLIATKQIRNRATAAGNLCQEKRCWFFRSATPCYRFSGPSSPCYAVTGDNRHHSILGTGRCAAPSVSDLSTIFAALRAEAVVQGPGGMRRVQIASLYRWAGEPLLDKGEYISSIESRINEASSFSFAKYARWKGDFAEASAAVVVSGTRSRLNAASVVLGAVAPTPHIAARAQSILLDGNIDSARVRRAAESVVEGSLPMTSNHYKVSLAVNQAQRAIEMALEKLEK